MGLYIKITQHVPPEGRGEAPRLCGWSFAEKMKKRAYIALLIISSISTSPLQSGASEIVIIGGDIGLITVTIPSPTNAITIMLPKAKGQWPSPMSGTNIACVLSVSQDGAAHTLTFSSEAGRYDASILSRAIDSTTGRTNISNPQVLLDGVTNDIIRTWEFISRNDTRFQINRE